MADKNFTKAELEAMSRPDLRRLACSARFGLTNVEVSNIKSEEVVKFILEVQAGKKPAKPGKTTKAAPKAAAKAEPEAPAEKPKGGLSRRPSTGKKKPEPEPEPEPETQEPEGEPEPETQEPEPEATVEGAEEVLSRIDHLGGALDEHGNEVKQLLEDLKADLHEIKKNQYTQWGMLCDIYTDNRAEDLDARLSELEAEFEGNG